MGLLSRDFILGHVQELFRDNLVAFLGSGSSAPYGLPTMAQLSQELIIRLEDPTHPLASFDESTKFRDALAGPHTLEVDMSTVEEESFLTAITDSIAECIGDYESLAFGKILGSTSHLELLVRQALRVSSVFSVVTTNYDRLVEFSAEKAGYPVNSSFVGSYCGAHDPDACDAMQVSYSGNGKKLHPSNVKHVRVFKPHGSLGWFDIDGEVRESSFPLSFPRKVIAPTEGKFREGYEDIYTYHRNGANKAVREARALLVMGYGFWDGHLHQTLIKSIENGTPTLIVTRSVTSYMTELVQASPKCLLLGSGEDATTRCHYSGGEELMVEGNLWDMKQLLLATFGPTQSLSHGTVIKVSAKDLAL